MLLEIFAEAIRNVRAHWLRVVLTGSGIVWGIALFVSLNAAGTAVRVHYREKMETIGRKVVFAFGGSIPKVGGASRHARRVDLEHDDPVRLPASPLIERAEPETWVGPKVLKGGGHIKVVWTMGVGAQTGAIRNFVVHRGRFISPLDVARHRRVLVIGAKVEERLFGRRSALGKVVQLEGYPFRIVGVSVPKGEQMVNMGPRDDEQVLMPYTTGQRLFRGTKRIDYVIYEPRTREEGWLSTARVRAIFSSHHHFSPAVEEALSFFNIADAIAPIELLNTAVQVFMVSCGLLTLAAGGIGVMNIMLVAVAERTRELAVRKSIGATNRDLFLQTLCETVVITLLAGALGIVLGAAIIKIMAVLRGAAPRTQFLMPAVTFSLQDAVLAFFVLVAVGIAAGIIPARRAARLDPAVSLRDE